MKNPENHIFNKFSFVELKLDKNKQRFLSVLIKNALEVLEHRYTLLFRYDTSPIEYAIEDMEGSKSKEIGEVVQALLTDKTVEQVTRERDEQIAKATARLENAIRLNKDLFFSGYIKKIEYKGTGTQITFGVYDENIPNRINEIKEILHNYQVAVLDREGAKIE